jgi:hypothetical protein
MHVCRIPLKDFYVPTVTLETVAYPLLLTKAITEIYADGTVVFNWPRVFILVAKKGQRGPSPFEDALKK